MTKATCSIDDCERPDSSRGWCRQHYERWRAYGDPLGAASCCRCKERPVRAGRGRKLCPECSLICLRCEGPKEPTDGSYCRPCMNGATPESYHLCVRCKERPKDWPRRLCAYCIVHCIECGSDIPWWSPKDSATRKGREGRNYSASKCTVCQTKESSARLSSMEATARQAMYRRVNLKNGYGITPDQYTALLEAQGGRCGNPGCRTDTPGGKAGPDGIANFHVDHDHACCPTRKCCGKCIRGLLCGSCNSALRTKEIMLGLVEYLAAHEGRLFLVS